MKTPELIGMPFPIPHPQTIKIRVRISGIQLTKEEQDVFDNYLQRYIHTLMEGLYIPGKINLSVKWGEDRSTEKISYKIIIHSNTCKIPLFSDEDANLTGRNLASKIAGYIVLNRTYLVNASISNTIQNLFPPESDLKKLPLLDIKRLLTEMVRRGFGLHRLMEVPPKRINRFLQHRYLLEALLQEVEYIRIKVRYNIAYHELANPEKLYDLFLLMQEGLYYELGLIIPKMDWEIDNKLADNEFIIQINDISYPISHGLKPNEILVNDTLEKLRILNIEGRSTVNPASGQEGTIVDKNFSESCENAGFTIWDPPGYLILFLSNQLSNQAGSLLSADLVENHLYEIQSGFPDLIDTFLVRYDLFTFTKILKDLLDEGLSIRDMRNILDSLLMINGTTQIDPNKIVLYPQGTHLLHTAYKKIRDSESFEFADYVRKTVLQAFISYKYTKVSNTLTVFLVDSEIEELIRNLKGKKMTNTLHQKIIEGIHYQMLQAGKTHLHPVILTTVDVRHILRKTIERELPQIPVLSYEELSPQINIQPISRISFLEGT